MGIKNELGEQMNRFFQRTTQLKLRILKFKEVQYNGSIFWLSLLIIHLIGSIFWLSLLIIHLIGLNFIRHEANDYFPEGAW